MSTQLTDSLTFPPAQEPALESLPPSPPSKNFWSGVLHDTFAVNRARVGAAWIAILILLAVFSPLLANSHPLLLKVDGHWSSPLLQFLTPTDVILFAMTLAFVVVFAIKRLGGRQKLLLLFLTLIVSGTASYVFIHPSNTIVYEEYREAARRGIVQSVVNAPIPYSANDRLRDQPLMRLMPPSHDHWLGTDANGSDVLSRLIHAARIALSIGLISTGIAVIIGILAGGLMGFFAGPIDLFGMRVIEMFEAIPTLFLLITVVAVFGRNLYLMMAIIGFTTWTGNARFIRAEFLRLRNQDFVQAAIAAGLPLRSILFRHMLPNGIAPVLISASFGVASAILFESTLSFLGLGLVDEPSWGQMLNQAVGVGGAFVWWIAVFPGLAIFLTVFAYNLVGESLQDAMDPKLRAFH